MPLVEGAAEGIVIWGVGIKQAEEYSRQILLAIEALQSSCPEPKMQMGVARAAEGAWQLVFWGVVEECGSETYKENCGSWDGLWQQWERRVQRVKKRGRRGRRGPRGVKVARPSEHRLW